MVTKKQLAALARGRAKRAQNCKISKRKTKAEIKQEEKKDDKKDIKKEEKKFVAEPTQIILYNGEPIEVPISKIPKKKSKWAKAGKYAKNAAIAAATLGALGYGAYRGKDIYDKYLKDIGDIVIDLGSTAVRGLAHTVKGAYKLGGEIKGAWQSGETYGESFKNMGKLAGQKAEEIKEWTKMTAARQRAYGDVINEIYNKGMAVIRDQSGTYFVLTNKDKTYLYDNNNKCITKDTNGNNISFDRNNLTEAYDLKGQLIWAKEIDHEPLYYDEYLINMMTDL